MDSRLDRRSEPLGPYRLLAEARERYLTADGSAQCANTTEEPTQKYGGHDAWL